MRSLRSLLVLVALLILLSCDALYHLVYPTCSITMVNRSSHAVTEAYVYLSDSESRGSNQLVSPLGAGDSISLPGMSRGSYTVDVVSEYGVIASPAEVDLISHEVSRVVISDYED